ncbi:polycystic kidney disease 1 like 1 [Gouania willdenowi]|uniref:polycystic kidney disease 1 like 1 n=1 Tax=Gouania willdenowi TaxID=441366 RepID=UPI001054B406|nr:polycystic kidney disease protein 1-like 1 [Gouania willdenowi]
MDRRAPAAGAHPPERLRDLDPAACAALCGDHGYQVALLSPRSCYCGNQLNASVVSECFDTSSNENTMDEKRGSQTQRSSSPSHGKTFILENSGKLVGRPVRIHAEKQTYPTNTDITLQAEADALDPVEFLWYFGDSTSIRTNSKTVTKKYHSAGRFDVVLEASDGGTSVTSDVFQLFIQRVVSLNRLVHRASVLQNETVTVNCRVNTGSNLTFLWSFGDGTITRPGQSTTEHVYHRTGEFTIEVTVSNLISSASLRTHIFVVDRLCQPPPVKSMGPPKLLVRRNEVIRLGVTYDTDVDCEASQGLRYTWTLLDSAGRIFPLPKTEIHRQSLIVQSHLLKYETYTAIARVQVISSVVYSNYSVKVEVMPSPPVALIKGGTNIFISKETSSVILLDGRGSYDADFPSNPLIYSWTCKPVSSISSSCFNQFVPISSPVLTFPVANLKANFDQFWFKLIVHSGNSSASSETFITVMQNMVGKVLIYCNECQGEHVNWNHPFSVNASCEDCVIPTEHVQYTWTLYLVNASSKPVIDVPFCHTVDLGVPSTINEKLTSRISHQNSSVVTGQTVDGTVVDEQDDKISDCETSSNKSRNTSCVADSSQSENAHKLLNRDKERNQHLDYFDGMNEFPVDHDLSVDWEILDSVVEGQLEEGNLGMSAGRFQDVSSGDFPTFDASLIEDVSSNLLDPKPLVKNPEPTVLDLPRNPVGRSLFESYTSTGIFSDLISFKPFSLRPNSRYMLEVTATSQSNVMGRTQLFLQTNPAPEGVTCQVQPVKGKELHTHFSVFCTSGREDLLYKYSYRVGGGAPRILYQGSDFQYYFSLPAGDPGDDYKVTIYTEIRSRTHGSTSKPCPVIVLVEPSFFRETSSPSPAHNDQMFCESGLKNLSSLLSLGNTLEIHNYVSLLSIVLNRLGENTLANTRAQRHMRSVLIGTMCELEAMQQETMTDSIFILKDLLQVKHQVSFVNVQQVTAHVQSICERLTDSGPYSGFIMNQRILTALIQLLSSSLQTITRVDKDTSTDPRGLKSRSGSPKQIELIIKEILETATELMLKFILLNKTKEHSVTTGSIFLKAAFQNQSSRVVSGGTSTFYISASLMEPLFAKHRLESDPRQHQGACFLTVLTEITHSSHIWAALPIQLSGPLVELNFYKCTTRRKISIGSIIQPIHVEMKLPQINMSSSSNYTLSRRKMNFHSFNITQQHLQESIQMTIRFTTPCNARSFPIMLLFRMFERPTPSMHHLYKIHRWGSNVAHITLPPLYLSAAGVGHLALLHADYNQTSKHRHVSEKVSYSVTVESSVCLLWDGQSKTWTRHGCRTQQEDTTSTVTCSCQMLRPLTVIQQKLKSSHDDIDVDPFLSESLYDLTILGVLLVSVLLYIVGMRVCRRADEASERNRRVHYLPDNCPSDPHLYVVTVHTGLWSAAHMSAKVYIVLHGEDGSSQTKELQVPGFTLFRRNSQDTFILSTADDLGAVTGIHIWHDNSGPSPEWYIKHVELSTANERRPVSLLLGHCWLAVNKGDGRVERTLRVRTGRISFTEMLSVKLVDYMADVHLWMSVCCCHSNDPFTHSQRLSVCLLLFLGYACVHTVLISQMDDQLKVDVIDVSSVSVTTGLLGVAYALPVATVMSLLFRMCGNKSRKTKTPPGNTDCFPNVHSFDDSAFGTDLSLNELRIKKQDPDVSSVCTRTPVNTDRVKERGILHTDVLSLLEKVTMTSKENSADRAPQRHKYQLSTQSIRMERTFSSSDVMHEDAEGGNTHIRTTHSGLCVAWTLLLLLSSSCLMISVVLGLRFSSRDVLLWIHSLFVSLICCIFLIQPAVVFIMAVIVSVWYLKSSDMHSFFRISDFTLWDGDVKDDFWPYFSEKRCSYFEKRLEARQRTRYLRLVHPLASAELRRARGQKRREANIQETLRNFPLCVTMLFLMMCTAYSSSSNDIYHLNTSIRKQLTRSHNKAFTLIHSHTEWWKWTQTTLLDLLYKNLTVKSKISSILIGEPVLQKKEKSVTLQRLVSMMTLPGICGYLGCYSRSSTAVGLGHTKPDAASKLERLQSDVWLRGQTMELGFTLYSSSLNLYTSVTLLAERSNGGVTLASSNVQSVRIHHTPTTGDYVIMAFQLVFLLLSLLRLSQQVSRVILEGPKAYWRTYSNWIEVILLTVTLIYYVYYVNRSAVMVEAVEQLQTHNHTERADIRTLAACEQFLRTLRGILLFLLIVQCVAVLRMSRTFAVPVTLFTRSLSRLTWPVISGVILQFALSSCGTLLYPVSFKSNLYWCLKTVRSNVISREISGVFSLSSFVVCTIVAVAVVTSTFKRVKRNQSRRNAFTVAEMASSIKVKVSEATGRHSRRWSDNNKERHWCQLEEFESAVDELLFRLNALTDSLHHTLPPKAHAHSPVFSALPELHHMDSQFRCKKGQTSHRPSSVSKEGRFQNKEYGTDGDHRLVNNTDDTSLFRKLQPISAELLVKVLIHDEPQRLNV